MTVLNLGLLEWIGYLASLIIAISMTMSSIVKFRLVNLAGATMFSIYGLLIGALPVAMLNGFIVLVDVYYLYGIFSKTEVFEYLEVRSDNRYLLRFLKFYNKDIQRFFPGFTYKPELNTVSFFILRDMAVAGIFLGRRVNEDTLRVALDYVVAEYRDFKNGKFVYHRLRQEFVKAGYHHVISEARTDAHAGYLKRLGFNRREDGMYEMNML